jgi:hypothetical protein
MFYLGILGGHIPVMVIGLSIAIINLYLIGGKCILSLKPNTVTTVNPLQQPIVGEDPVIVIPERASVKNDPDPVNVV